MDEQFVHEDQMRNARTQGVGSMVSEQNRQNALELMRKMHKIDTQNAAAKARIESNLDKALQCVDNVRDFVGSPEHILGNPKTKHGEIAENVDVWFHNADQIMHNRKADATFEGVGRTVATDYKVHGVDVQSKYINGANNSLSHVLKHMEDYYNHGSWKVLGTENQSNFMISVKIFEYEKFDYPRAVVSDCSFTNCFAASDSLINEYFDFKPVFSKNRYYRLIRQENNYGLNNMRNPSDFVESNNVKLKETNASGKKIGSSMPVEWDDSEYTTCKMATTWLNTFNKA